MVKELVNGARVLASTQISILLEQGTVFFQSLKKYSMTSSIQWYSQE